ncbi:hypothetical protein FAZ19_18400 [Sphingobacterium alkalisoli]|uniref:Uncharacterized protein n=1 Tax=Sphingobacterium alkalisoli TaxID=1874115 RepID=A0A4V5LY57_9SPHI|nr:hypothetical protein [Sphingobacterium alkalisoli]TJY63549.1 hypothetical protein FAZ19_18400 [Sphingobacterium alkalisoli]GGH26765.1 hypothetical protein GCM10011418_36250 [Sphingobacterium alkalisoli]
MFNFWRKNKDKLEENRRESFAIILANTAKILEEADLLQHAEIVSNIAKALCIKDDKEFIKRINGIEMWGGSGAVWEVYIDNKGAKKEFENEMIRLIDLMEDVGILGRGIKPIRKIFINESIK